MKEASNALIPWEIWLTLYHTVPTLTTLIKKAFENIVGGENVGNQHFVLFPQCFLPCQGQKLLFKPDLISAHALNFVVSKLLRFDEELTKVKSRTFTSM